MDPIICRTTGKNPNNLIYSLITLSRAIIVMSILIFLISVVSGESATLQKNSSRYVTYGDFLFIRSGDDYLQINSPHFSGNESTRPATNQMQGTFLPPQMDTQNITHIPQPPIPSPDSVTVRDTDLGAILTDSRGKTLYFLANDIPSGNSSACTSKQCLKSWPAFFVDTVQISSLSTRLNQTDFSSFIRQDGKKQTAYHGWPLYYYAEDTYPGDMKGQGYETSWYIAGVSGMIPVPPAPVPAVPALTPLSTQQQWYTVTFQKGGVAIQAEMPGYSINSFNQSPSGSKIKNTIQGGKAGIFLAGSGETTIQNVTFRLIDDSEAEIDPGTGYSITIRDRSGSQGSSANGEFFNDSPVHFGYYHSGAIWDDESPSAVIRMNNGKQFAVNLPFNPPGPGGYHLKLQDAHESVIYDITDWNNIPAGVSFDPFSRTVSFDPETLKNEPLTYTLGEVLTVIGISPPSVLKTGEIGIDLDGSRFHNRTMVYLTKNGEYTIPASQVTLLSSRLIHCTFPVSGAGTGKWNVMVVNPDGTVVTLPECVTITSRPALPPFPGITLSLKPGTGQSIMDSVFSLVFNKLEFLSDRTQNADFSLINLMDLSSIQIRYITLHKDTSSSSGGKFRSDLQNSGVYDDGGVRPGNGQVWMFRTAGPISSTPAVVNGTVFVGSADFSVYAIDMMTGKEKWKYQTGGDVFSSPAVFNNMIYVGSNDQNVYALDAADGQEKWRFKTGGGVNSNPAVFNGVVYVGSNDNYVYALDALNGQEKWKHEIPDSTSPAVANGLIIIGSSDSCVYALDATDGQEIWKFQTGDQIRSSPAVGYGLVYIGSNDHRMYALDVVTGLERWRFQTGSRIWSSPAVAHGMVYFGSDDTWVYAVDAFTGKRIWMFETGNEVRSSPAVANGLVYVGGYDSYLYSIDAITGGREKWMIKIGGNIYSSPVVANGMVIIGNNDGNVYAFGNKPYLQIRLSLPW